MYDNIKDGGSSGYIMNLPRHARMCSHKISHIRIYIHIYRYRYIDMGISRKPLLMDVIF